MALARLGVWTYRLETWAECACPEPGHLQQLSTSVQLPALQRRQANFDQAGRIETEANRDLEEALNAPCLECGRERREVKPPAATKAP